MRNRLPTTPLRVIGAGFLGALFPTAVMFTFIRVNGAGGDNPLPVLLTFGLGMMVMGIPGALGWFIMHVLGVRILGASLTGGLVGGVLLTLSTARQPNLIMLQTFAFMAVTCAVATALIWWVAYPKALRPAPTPEVFA